VTEHWQGGRRYQITVPSSSAPGPVDINSLIVPGSVKPYAYDPTFPDIVQEDAMLCVPLPPVYAPGITYIQTVAATTWTINTALGYDPGGITVIDGSGTIWLPESITYPSVNQVVLTFATAVAGTAYLS
jgi:hypothetical protein